MEWGLPFEGDPTGGGSPFGDVAVVNVNGTCPDDDAAAAVKSLVGNSRLLLLLLLPPDFDDFLRVRLLKRFDADNFCCCFAFFSANCRAFSALASLRACSSAACRRSVSSSASFSRCLRFYHASRWA